jgi:hypothetical protein
MFFYCFAWCMSCKLRCLAGLQGYLPGGNKSITTQSSSTVAAVEAALEVSSLAASGFDVLEHLLLQSNRPVALDDSINVLFGCLSWEAGLLEDNSNTMALSVTGHHCCCHHHGINATA